MGSGPEPAAAIGSSSAHSFGQTPVVQRQPATEDSELRRRRLARRLTGYKGWQERGAVVTVWSDDFGYFYCGRAGRKNYLPGRP